MSIRNRQKCDDTPIRVDIVPVSDRQIDGQIDALHFVYVTCALVKRRDVRKTEILFGFGFKKPNRHRTVQKFDIRSDSFSTETACKFAVYVKSDKSYFTCIQMCTKRTV